MLQSIIKYIQSDDDLGFQLDGNWGTGKTYFIKSLLIPKLEDLNKTPVYISLNGMTNLQIVKSKVISAAIEQSIVANYGEKTARFLNSVNSVGNLLTKAGMETGGSVSALLKSFGVTKNTVNKIISHQIDFTTMVFIIDDLERLPGNIPVEDVLGYISVTLLDEYGAKVIIVSNEGKLCGDSSTFGSIKEKVINKSIKFGSDTDGIAKSLVHEGLRGIENLPTEFLNWSLKILDELFLIFLDIGSINLRTIKSSVSSFVQFADQVRSLDLTEERLLEYLKVGFVTIFIVTDNYKRAKKVNFDGLYEKMTPGRVYLAQQIAVPESLSEFEKEQRKARENEDEFVVRYHGKSNTVDDWSIYTRTVVSLVLHDSFDLVDFNRELLKYFDPTKAGGVFFQLSNYWLYTESELRNIELQVKDLLKDSSQIDLRTLLELYGSAVSLSNKGLVLLDDWDIMADILRAIEKNTESYDPDSLSFYKRFHPSADEKLIDLLNDKVEKNRKDSEFKTVLEILNGEVGRFSGGMFFDNKSIFRVMLSNDSLMVKIAKENAATVNLFRYLKKEQSVLTLSDNDASYLSELIKRINGELNSVSDRVQKQNLNSLLKILEEISAAVGDSQD